jgi:hypothetical protein
VHLIINDEPERKVYKKKIALEEYKACGYVPKPKNITASPLDEKLDDKSSDEILVGESGDDVVHGMGKAGKERQVILIPLIAKSTPTDVLQNY